MEVHKVTAPAATYTNLAFSRSLLSPACNTTSWVLPPQRPYLQHVQQRHLLLLVDVSTPVVKQVVQQLGLAKCGVDRRSQAGAMHERLQHLGAEALA